MIWDVSESAFWGLVIAIALFWWLPLAATTRFIDLVSYFLGFLSLIVGLFAFYAAQAEKLQTIDRMIIKSSIVDIQFDTFLETARLCERVSHSPFRPSAAKKADCRKLNQYVDTLKFNPEFLPELTPLPELNLLEYSDPSISALARRLRSSQ